MLVVPDATRDLQVVWDLDRCYLFIYFVLTKHENYILAKVETTVKQKKEQIKKRYLLRT
jgi:hypothetical protein